MSYRSRLLALVVTSILILCYAVGICAPEAAANASKSEPEPPEFTVEDARTLVSELKPLVEQAGGRKFRRTPPVKIVDSWEISATLYQEFLPDFRKLFPEMTDKEIRAKARTAAYLESGSPMGKYGVLSQVLYLVPENLDDQMESNKVSAEHRTAILKLLICHELAHALHDQHLGINRLMNRTKTVDEAMAVNATIEGYAEFVQNKVAAVLKLEDAQREFDRLAFRSESEEEDPSARMLSDTLQEMDRGVYEQGKRFIEHQYEAGGHDLVWNVLAHPPASTSMILKPETYSAERSDTVDMAKALEGIESMFGKGDWSVEGHDIAQMQLRALYSGMDEKSREEVIVNIAGAYGIVAQRSDGRLATASIVILRDASLSSSYLSAVEQMVRTNYKAMESGKSAKVSGLSFKDIPVAKGDLARKIYFKVASEGETFANTFVRVFRGKALVELWTMGIPLPDAKFLEIAEKVFGRLPAEIISPGSNSKE